jgi:hypothetical protein
MDTKKTFRTQLLRWSAGMSAVGIWLLSPASLKAQSADTETNSMPVTVIQPTNQLQVTYAKDVAPLIQQNCERCHRPGSVAPMVLQTYEQAKAFAPLIKDRVTRRLMPPWPVDKTVGIQKFTNDVSLTDAEIATIVSWVDAGAPLGNAADMPEPVVWNNDPNRWDYEDVLGRPPDLVLTSPEYNVVANGRDQWPLKLTPIEEVGGAGLTEERWIMAIGTRPADYNSRYVFHHANASLEMPGEAPDPLDDGNSVGLIDSAVGSEGVIYPENTGRVIRPGSTIRWNMHYHPYDRDMKAALQLGLWFYPKGQEPKYYTAGDVQLAAGQGSFTGGTFPAGELKGDGRNPRVASEGDILLPPNSVATMRGYHVLDRPAMLNGMRGHMHMRGKYQIVEVLYPNGKWEVIQKLNWDHGWHTLFMYENEAMPLLPKGTAILLTSVFDNTVNNPYNPDPDQWVGQGDRSIDEMSHVRLELTYFSDEDFQKMVDERAAKAPSVASRQ